MNTLILGTAGGLRRIKDIRKRVYTVVIDVKRQSPLDCSLRRLMNLRRMPSSTLSRVRLVDFKTQRAHRNASSVHCTANVNAAVNKVRGQEHGEEIGRSDKRIPASVQYRQRRATSL